MWALLTGHHCVFCAKTVTKNADLSGKWVQLWHGLRMIWCIWSKWMPTGTSVIHLCIYERLRTTSLINMGTPYCALLHFPYKNNKKNEDPAGNWGQILAQFEHDMMHLEFAWIPWGASVIHLNAYMIGFRNIINNKYGHSLPGITAYSIRQQSRKGGSGWQMRSYFDTVCTWYDAFEVGGWLHELMWSISCISGRFMNDTSTANTGSPYRAPPHFPYENSHKNEDLAGKWGRILVWFTHDMMHLKLDRSPPGASVIHPLHIWKIY